MNHDITKQLKVLKRITPHPAFAARSRATLLAAAAAPTPWFSLQWAGAMAFAATLLIIATFSLPAAPTLSASLNEGVLAEEFNNLSINIELDEITYRAAAARTISSAITEINETEGQHLNTSVLESELSTFEEEASSRDIDTLLNAVLE